MPFPDEPTPRGWRLLLTLAVSMFLACCAVMAYASVRQARTEIVETGSLREGMRILKDAAMTRSLAGDAGDPGYAMTLTTTGPRSESVTALAQDHLDATDVVRRVAAAHRARRAQEGNDR